MQLTNTGGHDSGLGASIARLVFYVQDKGGLFWLHHDFERLYTQIIYIQVLEAGISSTAINLPPLWGLYTSISVHKVVRGVRSFVSLRSKSHSHGQGTSVPGNERIPSTSTEEKGVPDKPLHSTHIEDWDSAEEQNSMSSHEVYRNDLDGHTFAASASRQPDSVAAGLRDMHDAGGILVQKDLVIKNEKSSE